MVGDVLFPFQEQAPFLFERAAAPNIPAWADAEEPVNAGRRSESAGSKADSQRRPTVIYELPLAQATFLGWPGAMDRAWPAAFVCSLLSVQRVPTVRALRKGTFLSVCVCTHVFAPFGLCRLPAGTSNERTRVRRTEGENIATASSTVGRFSSAGRLAGLPGAALPRGSPSSAELQRPGGTGGANLAWSTAFLMALYAARRLPALPYVPGPRSWAGPAVRCAGPRCHSGTGGRFPTTGSRRRRSPWCSC